jgi:hypothetical protein
VAGLPTPTEAVYVTAVLVTLTTSSRLPFFANAFFRRAAARARSASAIFAKPVELNLVVNARENLPGLCWIGIAKTYEITITSRDRYVNERNIVIKRVWLCELCDGKIETLQVGESNARPIQEWIVNHGSFVVFSTAHAMPLMRNRGGKQTVFYFQVGCRFRQASICGFSLNWC